MSKPHRMILPLALSLGVLSCQPVAPIHQTVVTQVPSVQGQVTDLLPARSIAAQTSDVANGATVSLIDTATGVTVATTVTASNGSFTLNFGSEFKPDTGKPYYMEAVKGLPVGGVPNRAGAAIARVRTILFYNWNGWSSLSGGVGFPVSIGKATTTVAAIVSLKGLSTASQSALVGTVSGLNFTDPSHTIETPDFSTVFNLVDAAITADQDPLEAVGFDSSFALPSSQYVKKAGNLVIHDNYTTSLGTTISTPSGTVTFYGQNFPSSASVTIGKVPVATWSVNAARTQLTATLAANGHSGGLQITHGTSGWNGPFVPVSGTVGTIAGSGYAAAADGMGRMASFKYPYDIAFDAAGNLYLADEINCLVRRITPAGNVTTLAGDGTAGYQDGTGTVAKFNEPCSIAVDGTGNVYVGEYAGQRIRKITPAGVVSTLAGTGVAGFADGAGTTAQFNGPGGMAVDSTGSLYVSDYLGHRVRKIASDGTVSTLAGTGVAGYVDGNGTVAQFNCPTGIGVDTAGNVYVFDRGSLKIRKITPAGIVSTFAGTGIAGFTGAFSSAWGDLAFDGSGNIYMADMYNYCIRKISSAGAVITIAGNGTKGFAEGGALAAQVSRASGVALGSNGVLYIADYDNHRIRTLTP